MNIARPKLILTQKELCSEYSLSPQVLHQFRKEGLPCFIISAAGKMNVKGAKYRYNRAVFETWLFARNNAENR